MATNQKLQHLRNFFCMEVFSLGRDKTLRVTEQTRSFSCLNLSSKNLEVHSVVTTVTCRRINAGHKNSIAPILLFRLNSENSVEKATCM
jgi:hypothetical protein